MTTVLNAGAVKLKLADYDNATLKLSNARGVFSMLTDVVYEDRLGDACTNNELAAVVYTIEEQLRDCAELLNKTV